MKEQPRNYIVVDKEDNRLTSKFLLTKEEAINNAKTDGNAYYILDISTARKYNVLTTSRLVEDKPKKTKKKGKVK